MEMADMFESSNPSGEGKAPETGYLVTNQLNLMYMLAAGLMIPPAGFGNKYYRDTLERFPGWIPLFVDRVSRKRSSVPQRIAKHLKPCLVEVNLSGLSGRVIALGSAGMREFQFPRQPDEADRVLLIPAPLPVSRIASLVFRSPDDKRAVEADARDFGNVPIEHFKCRSSKPLFTRASDFPWPSGDGPEPRSTPLEEPLVAGGMMAMLLLFANLGEQAVHACRMVFDPDDVARGSTPGLPVLDGLSSWIQDGVATLPQTTGSQGDRTALQDVSQARLLWKAVERLVEWRIAGRRESAENLMIALLSEALADIDPRLKAGVSKLHDTLVSMRGLGDATASELFDRHDTPLAHALTLFFLRRDCADLVDYESDRLAEQDWLAAAILFAARDGWMNLPLRLRAGPVLSNAVSHRMARLSHRIAGYRTGPGRGAGQDPPAPRGFRRRFCVALRREGPRPWNWRGRRNGIVSIPASTSVRATTSSS